MQRAGAGVGAGSGRGARDDARCARPPPPPPSAVDHDDADVTPVAELSISDLPDVPKLLDRSSCASPPSSPSQSDVVVLPPSTPTFHQLRPGQDLCIPPRNWLQATLPDGTDVGHSAYRGLDPDASTSRDTWSLGLARHLFPNGHTTDFLAPADGMKEVFKLPVTTSAVSLSIHRLGDTLILDKDPETARRAEAAWAAGAGRHGGALPVRCLPPPSRNTTRADALPWKDTEQVQQDQLFSKFMYRTALPQDGESAAGGSSTAASGGGGGGAHGAGGGGGVSGGNSGAATTGGQRPRSRSWYLDELGNVHAHTDPTPSPSLTSTPAPPPPPPPLPTRDTPLHTTAGAASAFASAVPRSAVPHPSPSPAPPSRAPAFTSTPSSAPSPQSLYMDSHGRAHRRPAPDAGPPAPPRPPANDDVAPPATMFVDEDGRPHASVSAESPAASPLRHPPVAPPVATSASGSSGSSLHGHTSRQTFRRVCHWRFNGMNLVLGSNLLSFQHGDGAVSLRLQDVEQRMSTETACDLYLDNMMGGVPEVAVCYHQNGVVQSYQVVPTEDIPSLAATPFSPYVLEQNAATVLNFLQGNCTKPFGSYWLYRKEGDSMVQLYDLSSLPTSSSRQGRWQYVLAMLCYRYASQLRQLGRTKPQRSGAVSRLQLLQKCSELFEELAHPAPSDDDDGDVAASQTATASGSSPPAYSAMRALVYEELADCYLDATHDPATAPTPVSVTQPASAAAAAAAGAGGSGGGGSGSIGTATHASSGRGGSRRRRNRRKDGGRKGAGTTPAPDAPLTTEARVGLFNQAAHCLIMAINTLHGLSQCNDNDADHDDGGADGGAGGGDNHVPVDDDDDFESVHSATTLKLRHLRSKLMAVAVDCCTQLLQKELWHTALVILDNALSVCLATAPCLSRPDTGAADTSAPSPLSLLPAMDVVIALEVCGEIAAKQARASTSATVTPSAAAPSRPPVPSASSSPVSPLPFPAVMQVLSGVDAASPLPCLASSTDGTPVVGSDSAAGSGVVPPSSSADTSSRSAVPKDGSSRFKSLPAGRVAALLGGCEGFALPPLPSVPPATRPCDGATAGLHPVRVGDVPTDGDTRAPTADTSSLTPRDWLMYAVYCTWHASVLHGSVNHGPQYIRVARQCGELLNRWGQDLLAADATPKALAAFATGIQLFDSANDTSNAALLRCNVAQTLRSLALLPTDAAARSKQLPPLASIAASSELSTQAAALFEALDVEQLALLEVAVDLCETAHTTVHRASDAVGVMPQVADALASSYLTIGVTLSNAYQQWLDSDGHAHAPSDALDLVTTRTGQALFRSLRMYEAAGNRLQTAAAHFQVAAFHAANASTPVISDKPEQVRVVVDVAIRSYAQAAHVFQQSPAPRHVIVAVSTFRKRADLLLRLVQREGVWAAPDASQRALALAKTAASTATSCAPLLRSLRDAVARGSRDDAAALQEEVAASLGATRRAVLALLRLAPRESVKAAYSAVLACKGDEPTAVAKVFDTVAAAVGAMPV